LNPPPRPRVWFTIGHYCDIAAAPGGFEIPTFLKNLLNGAVLEKSFKTSEKFPEPDVKLASVSFLYNDPNGFHFMDQTSYEQFTISEKSIGVDRFYLKEGTMLELF